MEAVAYLDALDAKAQVGGCMLLAGCAHCVVCHLMYDCGCARGQAQAVWEVDGLSCQSLEAARWADAEPKSTGWAAQYANSDLVGFMGLASA